MPWQDTVVTGCQLAVVFGVSRACSSGSDASSGSGIFNAHLDKNRWWGLRGTPTACFG